MTKAILTVTGKHDSLLQFVKDHTLALRSLNHNETFFSIAVPIPKKFANDPGYKIEEWGVEHPPIVQVLRDKQPLEHPKDFSLDDILYSFHWPEKLVSPPNRWLERASELYELHMLLEFTDGDRITILECNKDGEVVLDKELERSAALEFFQIQARIEGRDYRSGGDIKASIKAYRDSFEHSDPHALIAELLIDALTEQELRSTLHLYANKMRKQQLDSQSAAWEETKKSDPFWSLHYKKQELMKNYEEGRKKADADGLLAKFELDHLDGLNETLNGLTTEYDRLAKELYWYKLEIRNELEGVVLRGDENRTYLFRKALKKVKKNWKDKERKAAKREERYKADKAHNDKVLPTEVPKLSLLDFNTPAININDLISDEAKSLKGDK